jgi:hypothetical protein
MPKPIRKFNGKLFYRQTTVWSKAEADRVAARFKREGQLVRIIEVKRYPFAASGKAYAIYSRGKKVRAKKK